MLMVNASGSRIRTDEFGGLDLAPGETVEIADGYCKARVSSNGSPVPSIVERLATGLVPAEGSACAPAAETDAMAQTVATLEAGGMPPAVAALVAADKVEPPRRGPGRPRKVVT